jgi:hypothetical protein
MVPLQEESNIAKKLQANYYTTLIASRRLYTSALQVQTMSNPALKKTTTSLKRQKITHKKNKKIQTLHLQNISKQERTEASPGTRIKLSQLGVARKYRDARTEQFATTNNDKKNSKIESRQETRAIDTY